MAARNPDLLGLNIGGGGRGGGLLDVDVGGYEDCGRGALIDVDLLTRPCRRPYGYGYYKA